MQVNSPSAAYLATRTNTAFPLPEVKPKADEQKPEGVAAPEKPEAPSLADELKKIEAYNRLRETQVAARQPDANGNTGYMVAIPVNDRGFSPQPTADQMRLMDEITDKYLNQADLSGMWAELAAKGVHPDQLAEFAQVWRGPDGTVVTREVATKGLNKVA
jgi:hypothetical protein